MSYKLQKPYTKEQKLDFIVKYNHNQGLVIAEASNVIYALEPWEKLENGEVVSDKESYEAEQEAAERERIARLSLTKREVFLALYKAKGVTPEQIRAEITDPEALIEFEYANDYYRGNPLIDLIGEKLGFTSEELDYLFENGELPNILGEEVESEDTANANDI